MPAGFAYSREFFRRYYTPDNATIIVAGDFDKKETLAHLTKAYGAWKGKLDAAQDSRRAAADRAAHARTSTWKTPTLPRLWLGWHTPARERSQRAPRCRPCSTRYLFGPTSPLLLRIWSSAGSSSTTLDADWDPTIAIRRSSACSCASRRRATRRPSSRRSSREIAQARRRHRRRRAPRRRCARTSSTAPSCGSTPPTASPLTLARTTARRPATSSYEQALRAHRQAQAGRAGRRSPRSG